MASSVDCFQRRPLGLIILSLLLNRIYSYHHDIVISPRAWGMRGGSTTSSSLDETEMMECFQEEVTKMRREMQQETFSEVEKLRQEIMQAKQSGALKQKNKKQEINGDEVVAKDEDTAVAGEKETEVAESADSFDLEVDFSEGLDDDLAPADAEKHERVTLFEDSNEDEDDFVVGDSDEEPEHVLDRMKEEKIKLEDIMEETLEEVAEELEDEDVDTKAKPERKIKKKKKKHSSKKNLVRPEEDAPKKKKKSKKKKQNTKLAEEKEAIHTALSSRQAKGNTLLVLKSSKLETLVKGVVLVVLLALAVLALRIVENSVTSAVPAATAPAAK